jgi:hypothetical protein
MVQSWIVRRRRILYFDEGGATSLPRMLDRVPGLAEIPILQGSIRIVRPQVLSLVPLIHLPPFLMPSPPRLLFPLSISSFCNSIQLHDRQHL